MDDTAQARTRKYISARKQHPAWLLLASRRAPLILGCLNTLFEDASDGIPEEDVLQALSTMLSEYAAQDEFGIEPDNIRIQAGRDLREWIKRSLVIERGQRIFATDALTLAIHFIDSLDSRIMTTTASRLSVVQREIQNLEVDLNPNPQARIDSLRGRIATLEKELNEAEAGHIAVLSEPAAAERIREIYSLATGLRADFRRVEDSWRDADRQLRQSFISENLHRGEVINQLLEGQDALLNTPEGRVFEAFQEQLRLTDELENMRQRLRMILSHHAAEKALQRTQRNDLKWLPNRLVKESQAILQARSQSERDVRGFLKGGLAAEHHRVGQLLTEVMREAQKLDWSRQSVRRTACPLPPIGIALGTLPIIERLRFKSIDIEDTVELDLRQKEADLTEVDDDFWDALEGLDRKAAIEQTLKLLAKTGRPMTLAELSHALPPTHDLETFALWLGMAREAGIPIDDKNLEEIELADDEQRYWRFKVPTLSLSSKVLDDIDWEL